jgi:hypothetical protein
MARPCSLLLAGILISTTALAQEPPNSVEVKGMKNPEMRSYRAVAAGLDAFDKHHALAPQVDQLRFRLAPTARNRGASVEGISMHIVGKGDPIEVPIGADGLYTIARDEAARKDNADLILNRKKDLFEGRVEVRTPGLAPNVRRLGDIRLECLTTVAIIKEELPFLAVAAINSLLLTRDWCNKPDFHWGVTTARRVNGAALVLGERRKAIEAYDHHLGGPTGERSWPDDALIEIDYAND